MPSRRCHRDVHQSVPVPNQSTLETAAAVRTHNSPRAAHAAGEAAPAVQKLFSVGKVLYMCMSADAPSRTGAPGVHQGLEEEEVVGSASEQNVQRCAGTPEQ